MVSDLNSEQFMNEEEAAEAAEEALRFIAEAVQQDEEGTHITNIKRLKDVNLVYKLLKYITSGKQLQILYELNKPFTSMAYISVVGRELRFDHPEWFVLCSNMASNVEIYARMDGCAQVNFTFNGFTNKID